jgi:serine/threonine protein phosphatase PrpC
MADDRFLLPSQNPHLMVSTFSHKGLIRENNEDSLAFSSFTTKEIPPKRILLAVLADGVGGHQAGEVASRISVETVTQHIAGCDRIDQPGNLLVNSFIAANQAILDSSQIDVSRQGMGSTCVCALILENKLFIANLGDSRLYLLRDRHIHQLTYDHTWLEELLQIKYPGVENIGRDHPFAHVLKRYLGSKEPVDVDLRMRPFDLIMNTEEGLELAVGDFLLLSSDGLSDLLTDQEIKKVILGTKFEKCSKKLALCALEHGGHDNVSIILIKIPKPAKFENR